MVVLMIDSSENDIASIITSHIIIVKKEYCEKYCIS